MFGNLNLSFLGKRGFVIIFFFIILVLIGGYLFGEIGYNTPFSISWDEFRSSKKYLEIYEYVLKYNPKISLKRFWEVYNGIRDGIFDVWLIENLYKREDQKISYLNHIDDLLFIGIGIHETNFKNTIGDNGKSIGYFQIQYETYIWVKEILKENFPKINSQLPKFYTQEEFKEKFLLNPYLQGKVVVYVIYFIQRYITDGNIYSTLIYYNNGRTNVNSEYPVKILKHLENLRDEN